MQCKCIRLMTVLYVIVAAWGRYQFVGWLALLDPRTIENEP